VTLPAPSFIVIRVVLDIEKGGVLINVVDEGLGRRGWEFAPPAEVAACDGVGTVMANRALVLEAAPWYVTVSDVPDTPQLALAVLFRIPLPEGAINPTSESRTLNVCTPEVISVTAV
jgi:hypothetical protein